MSLPVDPNAKVLASLKTTPSPPRPPWWKVALWIVPVSIAVAFSLLMAMGGLQHGEERPPWMLFGTALGWVTVALLATWGAFGRGKSAVGRARAWLAVIAIATPAVLFSSTLVWNLVYPKSAGWWEGRIGWKCLGLTLGMAIWPLVGDGAGAPLERSGPSGRDRRRSRCSLRRVGWRRRRPMVPRESSGAHRGRPHLSNRPALALRPRAGATYHRDAPEALTFVACSRSHER